MSEQQASNPSTTVFAWLIEKVGSEMYFSPGYRDGQWQWLTADPNEAVRFARKEDADRVRAHLDKYNTTAFSDRSKFASVEHGWMPREDFSWYEGEPNKKVIADIVRLKREGKLGASEPPRTAPSECPFCKRPADSEGGILHVPSCEGLKDAGLNKLQHHYLKIAQHKNLESSQPPTAPTSNLNDDEFVCMRGHPITPAGLLKIRKLQRASKPPSASEWSPHHAKTAVAITFLAGFRDGRIEAAKAARNKVSILGPPEQLEHEADLFAHAIDVLREAITHVRQPETKIATDQNSSTPPAPCAQSAASGEERQCGDTRSAGIEAQSSERRGSSVQLGVTARRDGNADEKIGARIPRDIGLREQQGECGSNPVERCTVPPAGWRCTRESGHDGPCAALPDETGESR